MSRLSLDWSLDRSPAPWLAGLDPMLAVLPEALPHAAREPVLHDAFWAPAERCQLAYRVSQPGGAPTFVAVEVTPDGWRRYDYRVDPELPGLLSASDPVQVILRLGRLLHHVRACRVQPVRYRPGSRCVLRYDVDNGTTVSTLYAKVVRPDGFARPCLVATGLASSSVRDVVPPVAAVWTDTQTIVLRAVPGRTVAEVLGDVDVPLAQRETVAFALGGMLARLHAQTGITDTRWTAQDQLHSLDGQLPPLRLVDPELGERLGRCVETLRDIVPAPAPVVLCHGSLRPGQVRVLPEGSLVVLDTDDVSRCVPGRDLGIALAHLSWQIVRQPENRATIAAAERALLSGYQCRAGPVDPQALRWWRASALVQVAARRYRRLEGTAWPLAHRLADAVEIASDGLRTARHAPRPADPMSAAQMSEVLHEQLPLLSDGCPDTLRVTSATALPSAPGRRRVIDYDVRGASDGVSDHVAMFGKVFTEPRRARLLYDHMCLLHYGPFHDGRDGARDGPLRVPEPVALLPEQHMVLYRGCAGVPLDRIAPARLADGITGAARWLARLHSCGVCLPRRFSVDDEARTCGTWAAVIGRVYPDLAGWARRLAHSWPESVPARGTDAWVPIHKDFHPAHVLVGTGICVVDLDEARQGDAAFDVAHFCAYLPLHGSDDTDTTALARAFMREYAELTGWVDGGAYAAFRGYTSLKIARQWATGSGPCRGASPAQRRAGTERALTEAERWLAA